MKKIFTFLANKKGKLLILKGSENDPQYHYSFWYTVTGSVEEFDKTIEDAVMREVKEETNLDVIRIIYLNEIYRYISLGEDCIEYVYFSYVDDNQEIILNEENIEYKWCDINEYLELIKWDDDKSKLKELIELGLKNK
jgi:8-oxo-dGTP pyrophosphatase MutT (NUDIX family)